MTTRVILAPLEGPSYEAIVIGPPEIIHHVILHGEKTFYFVGHVRGMPRFLEIEFNLAFTQEEFDEAIATGAIT